MAAAPAPHRRRATLAYLSAMLATMAAWVALVRIAVLLGSPALDGQSGAWVLLAVATLGAAACLLLTLVLGSRLLNARRGPRAVRLPGGRRARR